MKRLMEFPLEDGSSLVAEVDDANAESGRLRGDRADVVVKATQTLEASLKKLKPAATAIIAQLRDLADPPEHVAVEFGVKLSAAAGVVLASSGVEGNLKVTLGWRRETNRTAG